MEGEVSLKGSKTEENLKAAFAGESQANRRYLYFAQKADVEGYNDVSAVFRFRVVGAGAGRLALKSWRSWEGERSIVQRFVVTIDAAP